MPYYKFGRNDIVYNVLKTNPKTEFYIYQTKGRGGGVYYNNQQRLPGQFTGSVPNASPLGDSGYVSLYEMNVDRHDRENLPDLISAFVSKAGTLTTFKTITADEFSEAEYGDQLNFRYPLTSSITRKLLRSDATPDPGGSTPLSTTGSALKNTLNEYAVHSKHYLFEYPEGASTSDQQWDKSNQDINLITIPSIFYGSSIKKGTVELNFYISGTLAGQLRDINKNGELIQVTGAANEYGTAQGSGSVAGIVLYNEGFILLTGSWDLDKDHEEKYRGPSISNQNPKWIYWGIGAAEEADSGYSFDIPSSSFGLKFSGSMEIPTMTMFANAPKGAINHSNNTTYIKHNQNLEPITGAFGYVESEEIEIKNTTSSSFSDLTASFSKNTYISKIGIFDENKNLLGFAKLATPIKKTEERDLTFKLKLDI